MKNITHDELLLLWNIDVLCQRCIRLAHYSDVVSGSNSRAWIFTQNSYGELCVIYWCKVFGGRREPCHFRRLFSAGLLAGVTEACAQRRLQKSAGLSAEAYHAFWNEVKTARDKYMAHNEFKTMERVVFPDLDILVKVCQEMRDIIREILTIANPESEAEEEYRNIRDFVVGHDTASFARTVREESQVLVKAIW